MNIIETVAVVGIWFLVIAWTVGQEAERYAELDRAPVARGLEKLVEQAEAYAEAEYGSLWRCMDADSLPDDGVSREVDVPVFETLGAGVGATGLGQALDGSGATVDTDCVADRGVDRDGDAVMDAADGDNFPLSLEEAGFLPFEFRDLDYANEFWTRRGLRIRVVARFVDSRLGSPEIMRDLQLFVLVIPEVHLLSLEEALGVMQAMGSAQVAVGEGRSAPGAVEPLFRGYGGGWELEVDGGSALSLGNSHLVASRMFNPVGAGTSFPAPGELMGEDGEGALIAGVSLAETQLLGQELFRADIGVAGANRMETDVDYGGFGGVQMQYMVGVDEDGDGVVDWPMGIIGAPPGSNTPVTVDGDLHVTGSLTVGHGLRVAGQGFAGDPVYWREMDSFVGATASAGVLGPAVQVAGDAHFQNSVSMGGMARIGGRAAGLLVPAGAGFVNPAALPADTMATWTDWQAAGDPALQVGGRAHFSGMMTGVGGLRVLGAGSADDPAGILLVGNRVLLAGDAAAAPPAAGTPASLFSGRGTAGTPAGPLFAAEFRAEPAGNVTGAFADGDVGVRAAGNAELWSAGNLDMFVDGERQTDITNNDVLNIGLDRTALISGLRDVTVGSTDELDVGTDRTVTVGRDDTLTVARNRTTEIQGWRDTDVAGGDDNLDVSGDRILVVSGSRDTDISGGDDDLYVSGDRIEEID